VKNFFYFLCSSLLLASCSGSRKTATRPKPAPAATVYKPVYLENIEINSSTDENNAIKKPPKVNGKKDVPGPEYSSDIERINALQFKYGILMDKPVESVTDKKLLTFLDEWYGIPYRYGGGSKMGVDCSAFTSLFLKQVYNVQLPRTARAQYEKGRRVGQDELKQGDLVFFNTTGRITHVGVYLGRNKFAHASTSNGVMISDLDENYFEKRYAGAKRFR